MGLLLLAYFCLSPGIGGGFRFDDLVNLDALGNRGPITNWPAFWRYVTSGTADPTGRPLALLTFLADARDWPADPAPFLRTNILLHLLNGVLLFRLLLRLESGFSKQRAGWTALLATGLWLLHPLMVSTTLYVVQREAMLPATFVLVALDQFLRYRERFVDSGGQTGLFGMAAAVALGTLLAALAKANGILLPALALVLALTCTRTSSLPRAQQLRLQRSDLLLLALPSLAVAAYLLLPLLHWDTVAPGRQWSMGQRVLTEPRVLLDYLGLLLVPRVMSPGLFNEQFPVSSGLWTPPATAAALAAVLLLVAAAIVLRKRHPRFAAAMLFFFCAHSLESTTIPLELYFEHRNYLPATLLFWPLAAAIVGWGASATTRAAVATGTLLLLAAITLQRATLWGDPGKQARAWAISNPDSSRARASAAMFLLETGHADEATAVLLPLWRKDPTDLQLAFNYINARCASGGVSRADVEALEQALTSARTSPLLAHQWLGRALSIAHAGECPGLGMAAVAGWLHSAASNPAFNSQGVREQDMLPLLGELALYESDGRRALALFKQALTAHPSPDFAARLVSTLARHGQYRFALDLLDAYEAMQSPGPGVGAGMPWVHQRVLERQGFWEHEFQVLRTKLRADLESSSRTPERRAVPR